MFNPQGLWICTLLLLTPLGMPYVFQNVLQTHTNMLQNMGMDIISKDVHIGNNNNHACLETTWYRSISPACPFRHTRIITLQANNNEAIFSSVWYPIRQSSAPIFTVDLMYHGVLQSKNPGLINFVETHGCQHELYMSLKQRSNITALFRPQDLNSFRLFPYKTYLSKAALFSYQLNGDHFETDVPRIIEDYLGIYIPNAIQNMHIDTPRSVRKRHQSYWELRKHTDIHIMKPYFDKHTLQMIYDTWYREYDTPTIK